ncbi:MAG: SRPBCC domain-containing protein [Bacteroidia bacterium]|nr:SRPBCC domain-containing protein [Bacteroidia bacterium]
MEKNNPQDVYIEETFDASRERVFSAWTDAKKLIQWFAPDGCTISFVKLQIKEGGKFHSCVSNPQFGDCWCIGEYKEIIPNEKIVFTMVNAGENGNPIDPASIGMDPNWPGSTIVTVTFSDDNGKTVLRLHQTVSKELAQKTGAYPSWLQMLSKMQAHLNFN